jgi:hypothetical protein
MPRLTAATADSVWQDWEANHPCPADEDGAPCINDWLFKAAGFCAWSSFIDAGDATDFIRRGLTRREKFSTEASRAVARQYAIPREQRTGTRIPAPKLVFEPWRLEKIVKRVSAEITDDWLAERSAINPSTVSPSDFLTALYRLGETVAIVTGDANGAPSVLAWLWKHGETLEDLTLGQKHGVWFQTNPVDGQPHECEDRASYRCEAAVTAWRYGVLESDHSEYDALWRKALVQLPLAICAIYTSGGRSTHALYRVPETVFTKPEFDDFVRGPGLSIKNQLVPVGADPAVFKGVQLSRLPGCRREEKETWQRLLYFSPNASEQPISKL